MLFHSSIRRELTRAFAATLFVLLVIVITMMLIRTLNFANKGTVNPSEVTLVMGFTVLAYLPTILTLSLFISIVYTLSRMYRDSEMAVWFASGQGLMQFLRPLLTFGVPVILLVAALSLAGWPWANARTQQLLERYQGREDLDRIAPGQFQESADGKRVFYVNNDETGNRKPTEGATRLFVFARQPGSDVVISASSGQVRTVDDARFAVLLHGQSAELHDDQTLTISRFEEYGIRLKGKARAMTTFNPADPGALQQLSPRVVSTPALLGITEPRFRGELGWRIGMALAGINFLLLGLAASHTNPRSGRSGGLLLALLFFIAYYNLLNFGKNWVATGKITMGPMLVLLHGGIFLATVIWLWSRHNQWSLRALRPRRPAPAAASHPSLSS